MKISFEGQVALVTGAGAGMGLATAGAFTEAGAAVMLADVNSDSVEKATNELLKSGYTASWVRCDVADEQQVKAMVEKTIANFGRLDAAYNNAGIQSLVTDTADLTSEEWDRVFSVNLRGVFLCMKYELMQMREQGSGAIVNCSSIGGLIGLPGRAAYHAAKHGVLGLTKSAALEYAPRGIRINAVCPGTINTPMVSKMFESGDLSEEEVVKLAPINRLGQASEIADTVLWLCSPMSTYVIGQAIAVDGGYTVL
jgi:NAD(P)-dependent dehydrogenase (short-subunit alcohol dehydrogenase family)